MDRIESLLSQRKADGLLRTLRPADFRRNGRIHRAGREFLDFSSNDYLGLANHPRLKEVSRKAAEEFGTGSSASRLLSGDSHLVHLLEEKTASFKGTESALVFNSGYQANVGIISALCRAGDAVFCDKLSHASILDGAMLSKAKLFRFAHNDPSHLESLLKKHVDKFDSRLIVTETIFSMDGDRPPLRDIVDLKNKYRCRLMVDEAHATGIFAKDGSGIVAEEGLVDEVDLIMGTFGKALGSFGAYVTGSKKMIQYLVNTCRSFIYSTALPPAVIAANLAALELIETEPFRRIELLENALYFRTELAGKGFEIKSCSQIVPVITGDTKTAAVLSERLSESGYWVLPIRPPTVPKGRARLRFSLTWHHNKKILSDLIEHVSRAV